MSIAIASYQLPFTFSERLALGEDEIRIPATFEEYLAFDEQCEYKVEYSNKHIISMGSPTDAHEKICNNVAWALTNLFQEDEPYDFYGSNLGILIPDTGAHYKPDNVVLNAPPAYVTHKVGKRNLKSILNPFAVVEVFSDGTLNYDMTEKLPNYRQCSLLHYIIYIHQHKPFVTVYTRSEESNDAWLTRDHFGLEASFLFENRKVALRHIYRKVVFMGIKKK